MPFAKDKCGKFDLNKDLFNNNGNITSNNNTQQ